MLFFCVFGFTQKNRYWRKGKLKMTKKILILSIKEVQAKLPQDIVDVLIEFEPNFQMNKCLISRRLQRMFLRFTAKDLWYYLANTGISI